MDSPPPYSWIWLAELHMLFVEEAHSAARLSGWYPHDVMHLFSTCSQQQKTELPPSFFIPFILRSLSLKRSFKSSAARQLHNLLETFIKRDVDVIFQCVCFLSFDWNVPFSSFSEMLPYVLQPLYMSCQIYHLLIHFSIIVGQSPPSVSPLPACFIGTNGTVCVDLKWLPSDPSSFFFTAFVQTTPISLRQAKTFRLTINVPFNHSFRSVVSGFCFDAQKYVLPPSHISSLVAYYNYPINLIVLDPEKLPTRRCGADMTRSEHYSCTSPADHSRSLSSHFFYRPLHASQIVSEPIFNTEHD